MEFIRIYIPQDLLRSTTDCNFYGDFRVYEKSTIFFITSAKKPADCQDQDIKYIGSVKSEPINSDPEVCFLDYSPADQSTKRCTIKLRAVIVNGQPVDCKVKIQVIIFDSSQILSISAIDVSPDRRAFDEEFVLLLNILKNSHQLANTGGLFAKTSFVKNLGNSSKMKKISEDFGRRFEGLKSPFSAVRNTAVFQHLFARQMQLQRLDHKSMCTLALDVFLGIAAILALLYAGQPYVQLTTYTEMVVIRVRSLLAALKGFPIGLKLNIELNNFLLDIFTYHINLWVTFLVLIAPVVDGLFVPFVFVGTLGFSFHLAILSDLLVFISLHAHCFYIYVAVLYHAEIEAISSLWRVLLGKRFNPLKNRVESHEYSNPQLYLATLFFAGLLFLMPTVLLYYVVFSFLRFCVYCLTYVLITIQRHIMTFPVYNMVCRTFGVCVNTSNVELRLPHIERGSDPHFSLPVSYVEMRCHGSAAEDDRMKEFASELPEMMSVFEFAMGLVKGNIMGFILPLSK